MANADALAGLTKWLRRDEWRRAFDETLERHTAPACEATGVALEELPDLIGDHHATVLWGCVLEDLLTRDLADGRNIADDYLKRRGWKESASNRAYVAALRSSVMSLYEISDIVPEQSFLARDLVRAGEPVRVSERSGTRYLKPWDRIAARIVRLGPRTEMAGGAIPLDYDTSESLLKALRLAGKKARTDAGKLARRLGDGIDGMPFAAALTDTELLRGSAFMFTNLWLGALLKHPTLPEICNSDGDELVFTTSSYPLKHDTSPDRLRLALAAIPALRPKGESFWNWIGTEEHRNTKHQADKRIIITTMNDDTIVLGTLELKGNRLVLETNSQQRAERGRALLAPALGALVDEPLIEARTVSELMASPPADTPKARALGLTPDEERAIVHASLDQHYAHVLDQPVPMLGDMTPRRAARSAKGREKLVAWLKLLENGTARHDGGSPMASYDVTWLWEELGVAGLRR